MPPAQLLLHGASRRRRASSGGDDEPAHIVEDKAESVHGRWFPLALAAHGTVTTLLVALSGGALQFVLFHTSFGTLEFYSLYRVYLLWSKATGTESPAPVAVRRLYRQGFGCYGVGLV